MKYMILCSLAAAVLAGAPVAAEGPAPFPEFEAKRVGVPKAGARRITVQIDPAEQFFAPPPPPIPEGEPVPRAQEPVGAYSWFWDRVSPEIFAAGPGRLEMAMNIIEGTGGVPQPRLQHLQAIARSNGIDILKSTVGTQVSPALVLALISVESSGRTDAESHAGAQGLMQLMPATAERFGVKDRLVPSQNIEGGVRYLDWLMSEFGGDPILVLAGYNAGEGAVRKHAGVPPYAETRNYVPKVLAAFQVARGLCLTPPELVSDGCVFAGLN
ncbi:lytic transglycosylase domain-containing protein [uncultured Roseobacter sp.]|uniref:lytic transglycosylase domain-containing protein n=1 Tax=uncultured Roseobacter sp. TaxID=114847 RepID=UPI002620C7F4|nr:lytic transglycosylase domain-containing protein [uncultured Roseobacter sp.]